MLKLYSLYFLICLLIYHHEITIYDACHKKTDLKVFVVVIPKDGWVRVAVPILLLYDTDIPEFDSADIIDYIFEKPVSCQKKDGHGLYSRDVHLILF